MHKAFFLPICMSVHHMHVWCPMKINTDSLIPPGTEDTGGCELSCRSQEMNPGSLQEQQVPKY